MAGPSQSRIQRAGGDVAAARRQFETELASGQAHLSGDQQALLARDPEGFFRKYLGQTTKGKFSGPLGAVGKVVSKVAPIALPLVPGLGPLAAGALSATVGKLSGKNLKESLTQGALTGAGSALLGGQGYKGVSGASGRLAKAAKFVAGKGGLLSKASSAVGGPLNLATLGLSGVNAIQSAQAGGRSNVALDRALGALPNPEPLQRENLDSLFADPADPYRANAGRPRRAARAASAALAGGGY